MKESSNYDYDIYIFIFILTTDMTVIYYLNDVTDNVYIYKIF